MFGVFRVKNHDFTPKNLIFSNCEGGAKIVGVFRVKNHEFKPKNLIFSNFRGGARRVHIVYALLEGILGVTYSLCSS